MPASAFVQLGGETRSGRWFGRSSGALAAHGSGASSSTSRTKSVALAIGQTAAVTRGAARSQLCACVSCVRARVRAALQGAVGWTRCSLTLMDERCARVRRKECRLSLGVCEDRRRLCVSLRMDVSVREKEVERVGRVSVPLGRDWTIARQPVQPHEAHPRCEEDGDVARLIHRLDEGKRGRGEWRRLPPPVIECRVVGLFAWQALCHGVEIDGAGRPRLRWRKLSQHGASCEPF